MAHRTPIARAAGAALLVAASALLSACGVGHPQSVREAVARPVDPPPLPAVTATATATTAATRDGLPESEEPPAPREHHRHIRSDGILSAADLVSFQALARSLPGRVGLAVSGIGVGQPVEQAGALRTGVAWSTSKVPVAMAVIAAGRGEAKHSDLQLAITESDNAAADRLWASLNGSQAAAAATDEQLRAAGDQSTQMQWRQLAGPEFSSFGQTRWSLANQARFTAGMSCVPAGSQVLTLMGRISAAQRWGLGATGVPAQFKGGWGPGIEPGVSSGYFERQMGIVTLHGKPLAVAIAALPGDGSHTTGTRELTAVASWLVAHANVARLPADAIC